jgi:hypothetical protein
MNIIRHSAEFVTGFARLKVQPAGSTRIPAIHETFGGGLFLWRKGVTLRDKKLKNMQAYEFNAVVCDGMIPIPEQLCCEGLLHVKVILLADAVQQVSKTHKSKFTAMRLKTKGHTFNREDAHER